jgi:hypothetical protein
MSAVRARDSRDVHCCSAMTLPDRQIAADAGLTCTPTRCVRAALAERRAFDALVAPLRDGAA